MTKNPIFNALGAFAYIALVVTVMNFVSQTLKNTPDTTFAPVVFLSLFTLSVSVMAYMFFYQPIRFLIEGKKKESVNLFVQTIGIFGVITVILLTLLMLKVI